MEKKTIRIFEYPGSPYCYQVRRILSEIISEHPEYSYIRFIRVDEVKNETMASAYNYKETPAIFQGKEKLYETDSSRSAAEIRIQLENMLHKMTNNREHNKRA